MGIGAVMRAVFLDRDGVLNESVMRDGRPYPPGSVEEVRVVSGAAEALARLKSMGLLLIVVTNQPDVARGTQTAATVEAIHRRLAQELPIDEFMVCFHDDPDQCACRKPKPGMILEGAVRRGADLARSFLVGDRWRDIEAGQAAGCQTVWIDRGYRERAPARAPDAQVTSLREAVEWIVRRIEAEESHGPGGRAHR
jgi:D-glycero-D-manno-heptose 1,7-bisphosphate phosphatase